MSKTVIGDACAAIPSNYPNGKTSYRKIGVAFRDDERGSISIKIDCLPLPGENWKGWINIFEQRRQDDPPPLANPPVSDDIPF